MRIKVPLVAIFWTFALAIPFTVLALAGVAYINLHFSEMALAVINFEKAVTAGGRGLAAESSERMPELAGMIIGLIVMLTIYLFVRKPAEAGYEKNK